MCATCGCSDEVTLTISKPGREELPENTHTHHHEHESRTITLEKNVLEQNNLLAERNRGYFEAKQIKCINLVSSPGAGKTTLLEETIRALPNRRIYVIEGDQQTLNDANRIHATGAPVVQVNTGNGCHLDAQMINDAVKELQPAEDSLLIIENVGNLVCPALFDLGETQRVVIISTAEGDDKPVKYPNMFATSNLCIINKTDLLPYVPFDMKKVKEYARKVNQNLEFIELSAYKGDNLDTWYQWLK